MVEAFKVIGRFIIDNKEANEGIEDTTRKAKEAENGLVSSFKKIGAAVATYFAVDKIIEFGKGCIQAAADANAANSQFSQVFGELESKAKSSLSGIADETGIVETRMKGSYTQIAAFAKTSGMDTEAALNLSNRAMVAVADSAAFYDRTLEETTESLQSFLKGNFENDAALGLSCTETTRNAAANKLYGKSFQDLSESQKQLTLLKMVEDANKASGALGQAARESNTWTNQTGNLKQAWTNFQAVLGQPILQTATNIVGGLAEKVSNLAQKFSEGENPVQTLVDKVSVFLGWCKDIGSYISTTFQPAIGSLQTAFTTVKDALQPLIDKITDYVTEGGFAEDVTDGIKAAADLLSTAVQTAADVVTDIVTGFQDMVQWGRNNETTIQMLAIAFGTLTAAIGAYNIAVAIKNAGGIAEVAQLAILQVQLWAMSAAETAHSIAAGIAATATTAFGAAVAFLTSPITLVIAAIGALIAIGVLLYKNWDTIKEKCSQFGEKVSNIWTTFKQKTVDTFTSVINWVKKNFTSLLTFLINPFAGLFDYFYKNNTKFKEFVDNAVKYIKELPGKVWTWLQKVIEKVTTWATDMGSKAKTAATNFLTNVINNIKNLPGRMWTNLVNVISKITSWGSQMVTKGKAAAQKLLTTVVTKIKEMPGKIKNVGLDIVKGIGNGITNGLSWIKNKITSFVGNVTKFIKKLFGIKSPSTVMRDEVGREISRGVAVGIEAETKTATGAMENLGKEVISIAKDTIAKEVTEIQAEAAKESAEIQADLAEKTKEIQKDLAEKTAEAQKSSAKKSKDNQDKIAKNTAEANDKITKNTADANKKIADLNAKTSKKVKEANAKLNSEILKTAKTKLDTYKQYNSLTAEAEAMFWDDIRKQFKEGTEERIEADKAYFEAKNRIESELLEAAKKRLENYKVYNEMTLAEEVGFWDDLRQNFEEGTDARIEADKEYLEAKKSINEKIVSAEEKLQSRLEEIASMATERQKELLDSFDLFGNFNPDESGLDASSEMLLDLQAQINSLEKYDSVLNDLEARMGGTALFDHLKGLGMDSINELMYVTKMTDDELKQYIALFDKRSEIAGNIAKEDVKEDVIAETQKAYEEFSKACSDIGVEVSGSIEAMKTSGTNSFAEFTTSIVNGLGALKEALADFKNNLELPNLSVSTDLDTSGAPSLNVEWYASAMRSPKVMNKPTIFGYNAETGNLMGGGEAGSEVVSGTSTLMSMIQTAVAEQNAALCGYLGRIVDMMAKFFPDMLEALDIDLFIDGRRFATELAPDMDDALGIISTRKERGR